MSWIFPLESANLVAYLTSVPSVRPPRVRLSDLSMFLGSIGDVYRDRARLISSDKSWIETMQSTASACLGELHRSNRPYNDLLDDETVAKCLAPLKPLLSAYELFALSVGDYKSDRELAAFVDHAAYSSRHHAIFLSPDLPFSNGFELLDPFPAISLISEQLENWPGILFWSRSGAACFAPLPDAFDLYERIRRLLGSPNSGQEIDEVLLTYRSIERSKRILHLSDLHFGNDDAIEKEAYVSGHLESVLKDVDRVVITGDLFNEPKREQAIAFRNFRASIQRRSGKDPIVIPGNHDQKWLGNFGSPLREMANLEWSSLVFDDDISCVFYCFDSSRDADWAHGKVTKQQMLDVATLFVTNSVSRTAINQYLPVALVHHHPFSFETTKESLIDRALERIGITDELFLSMEDADAFLAWCAKRGVQMVLHGHKHVPRYVSQNIQIQSGDTKELREINAISCGTTLGAEGKPLSYNLLTWDPASRRWSVSFFADPGDGSGFTRQKVALHTVPEPPFS